jgi:outer membrane receptor protein involved in Fe transport
MHVAVRAPCARLIVAALFAAGAAGSARAQDEPAGEQPETETALSPEDQALLDEAMKGEVIEVWAERPNRPFDRDTELRLTGAELARRGVTDLAQALEYLPEINVRAVNRGGRQVDVRGARKGSVKVLLDGVPIGDPYRGNLDLSSIPVTDIVEVRVSTTPASPIDGTGGPGGVIEVHTRDAIGARWLGVRADVNTLPQTLASASARSMISEHWAARVSATGDLGGRDIPAVMPTGVSTRVDEDRRTASGALRMEYRRRTRSLVADLTLHTGGYIVPPSETETDSIVLVDDDDNGRLGVAADDELGGYRLQLRGYAGLQRRDTIFYPDAEMIAPSSREKVVAQSQGGAFLINRPIGDFELIGSAAIDSEHGDVENGAASTGGRATISALAAGSKFVHGPFRADAAAGVAIPVDVGTSPWPEAKLTTRVSPHRVVTARLVGGYKGRLPTLRERFESNGNDELGPEKVLFAEAGVALEKNTWVSLDAAGWVRRVNGMIRFVPGMTELTNVGETNMRGADGRITILPYAPVRAGGSLSLVEATSEDFGDDAVDRLPGRRGDVWMAGDWRQSAGAMVRYRYTGNFVDQGVELDDYWLLDASSYYWITRDIMAGLRVDNALDERYLDRAGGVMGLGRVILLSAQGTWE